MAQCVVVTTTLWSSMWSYQKKYTFSPKMSPHSSFCRSFVAYTCTNHILVKFYPIFFKNVHRFSLLKALAKARRALANGLEACVRWMLFINATISIQTIILKILHYFVKFCITLHKKLFTAKWPYRLYCVTRTYIYICYWESKHYLGCQT